jgi:hypothetical protein
LKARPGGLGEARTLHIMGVWSKRGAGNHHDSEQDSMTR